MPFGEMWYNQQASAYNERFKFTGKERDDENGYLVISPFALPATATHSEWRWIGKKNQNPKFFPKSNICMFQAKTLILHRIF